MYLATPARVAVCPLEQRRTIKYNGRKTNDRYRKEKADLIEEIASGGRCEWIEGKFQSPSALLVGEGPKCGDQPGLLPSAGTHSQRPFDKQVDSNSTVLL